MNVNGITNSKIIAGLTVLTLMTVPVGAFARVNSLIGGLSTGYDYSPDSDRGSDNDKSERVFLSPMLHFSSLSERDSFELQASPSIKYDLDQYNTDWDSNVRVAADRFMTKDLQMGISNHYLVSDYFETGTDTLTNPGNPSEEVIAPTDPDLSSDRGRQRYWRNSLSLFSNYAYREDSSFRLDLGYVVLRNDGETFNNDDNQEYDRYSATLGNKHRYNAIWSSAMDFQFVFGDFKENDFADELSDDLKEYRLSLAVDNESIIHNPISLSFDYTAARYDESERNDDDIFQMRLTWRRDFSPRLYTILGAGPSYSKTEGQDAQWGGNGIAEIQYDVVEHGFLNFRVEKNYDVDNFSGSDESGVVDTWATILSGRYQLRSDLGLSGRLGYLYEDREELSPEPGDANNTDTFHEDRYIAGAGLRYTFLQFYTASVDYTFTKLNSDRSEDDYDDHRVLLTLSWQQELLRW